MGRLIVFEMATLLQVAGAVVELVALGDTTTLERMLPDWERVMRGGGRPTLATKLADHLVHWRGQVRRRLVRVPRLAEQWAAFKIRNDPFLTQVRRLLRPHQQRRAAPSRRASYAAI